MLKIQLIKINHKHYQNLNNQIINDKQKVVTASSLIFFYYLINWDNNC